ncbi:MAG: CaiB/BaiF CoA transferase family protein, partial [Dehalococcoidia bacterium]
PPFGDISRTTGPYQNGWSSYYFSVNRGKKSISIDLRKPEGRDLFLGLVEKVDVVMENFTPGTMERLGLGWDVLSARNPRLIFARTSGFGQTGPYKDRPALDIIVQAMGGVMSITGEQGGRPVRPGVSYGDVVAGLYTAIGIMASLHERAKSGLGQMVDISMLDCQISCLENAISRYHVSGEVPQPIGTRHPVSTPFQAFPTADGYVVVALGFGSVDQWALLCSLIETPDLIDDPRFNTGPKRTQNHGILEPLLEEAFRRRPTQEWLALFLEYEIPAGPIQTIDQVVKDPQVVARGMIHEVTHPKAGMIPIANTPVRLSRSESGIKGPPADLGQHTAEVLGAMLGLDEATIAELAGQGVVAMGGGPDVESLLK